ncbi:DUF397 domain-containing protein [Nocardia fusca]|uniref:DUF397 domain-containing protein n=1 Tax=Nocardia fusca TaxID=941183 RepID=UPI0037C9E8AF
MSSTFHDFVAPASVWWFGLRSRISTTNLGSCEREPEVVIDPAEAWWFKSSYSGPARDCVEAAHLTGGAVGVRDSKRRTGPDLFSTPPRAWDAFLTFGTDRPIVIHEGLSAQRRGPSCTLEVSRSTDQWITAAADTASALIQPVLELESRPSLWSRCGANQGRGCRSPVEPLSAAGRPIVIAG